MPLSTEPCERATVSTMPNIASAKYSGAPKATANRLKRRRQNAGEHKVAMQPATNEPMAEMARAAPARPAAPSGSLRWR